MASLLSNPVMPEETDGPTVTKRYVIEVTAHVKPGEEPTPEQVRDFFNAFFSEGFKQVWRAATCDKVESLP
jgi:hypothetical protein